MIRRLIEFWREATCIALISFMLYMNTRYSVAPPDTSFGRFAFFALVFADVALLYILLRDLWHKKWRHAVAKAGQKVFAKAAEFVIRFLEKWNIGSKRKSNVLIGNTILSFDGITFEKRQGKQKKLPKWKQLETDSERLGFLYRHMITVKLKNGMSARANDTPSEIRQKEQNSPCEEELFDLYISARYDERVILKTEKIDRLKQDLSIK